ncbi:MAG: MEDS domain-containing protein [Methanotrichaceae archaeon]|nr:MEDS domain-containing protein [Methanotrichaceae archaeon]
MGAILRRSGIKVVGDVPWGTHFCQFYESSQDLIEILVPYFCEGLKGNEFCMWVTSETSACRSGQGSLASSSFRPRSIYRERPN